MADNEFTSILLGGNVNSEAITVLDGESLSKGDVVAQTAAGTSEADGTGDGVMGDITLGAHYQVGVYALVCTDASVAGSEVFSVYAPDGSRLEDLTVAVAYDNGQIAMTLAAGSTEFIVGDSFDITVAKSGKYAQVDSASTAGAFYPEGILVADADATDADVTGQMWITGEFDVDELSVGTGDASAYKEEMRRLGMILKSTNGGNY